MDVLVLLSSHEAVFRVRTHMYDTAKIKYDCASICRRSTAQAEKQQQHFLKYFQTCADHLNGMFVCFVVHFNVVIFLRSQFFRRFCQLNRIELCHIANV